VAPIPDRTNFYCSVDSELQPASIARLFQTPVWRVRKNSWTDFEAVSDFAELVIEASSPVLIHGAVAEPAVNGPRIVEPLTAAGLYGNFECYGTSDELILEAKFGRAGGTE
jgi:hypothetical protein